MKYFVLFILLFFIVSCRENNKKALAELVIEWQGKEIIFPEKYIFTHFAIDTTDYIIPENEYKILVYVDSVGCTSCKLQLSQWALLINELDSITDKHVPVLFFLQSRNLNDIKHILKREQFGYPVCIDEDDQLNKINHFPNQAELQTFLLDRDNKVTLIGSPVHNLSIKELYLNEIRLKY